MRFGVMGGRNPDHMIIEAKVKTGAKEFAIEIDDGRVTIYVRSPPEHGRANSEITHELSKRLGGPVKILKGHKSKKKLISVPESWGVYHSHDHEAGQQPG